MIGSNYRKKKRFVLFTFRAMPKTMADCDPQSGRQMGSVTMQIGGVSVKHKHYSLDTLN